MPTATSEPTVTIHALDAGHLTCPERIFISPATDAIHVLPTLSFLVEHTSSTTQRTTRILFDLGFPPDFSIYPEDMLNRMSNSNAVNDPNVITSLAKGGLGPKDIDYVFISHVHMDHTGDPSLFPDSTIVLGPETKAFLKTSESWMNFFPDSDRENVLELAPTTFTSDVDGLKAIGEPDLRRPWTEVKHLPHALDLFGDGSVYVVDAMGHLPGHLNLLVHTSDGKSIYLGGDSSHDLRVVTGECVFATGLEHIWGPQGCPHLDLKAAEEVVRRMRLLKDDGVETVLAHDAGWERNNQHRFLGA